MTQTEKKINNNNHVIVISYDAFSIDNWNLAIKQPNLAKLIAKGSSSNQVLSVYPTLTYIIHTSYVTGMYPNKHGVYHNNPLQPFVPSNEQAWFWYRKDIQAPTIFEVVSDAGLTTASLLWPVSGKATITYNIPEIRATKNENQALKILKNGSPLYSMGMELKYGKIRKGIQQPYLDDFTLACAVDTIKRKKPNLFTIHLIDLDDFKHEKGTVGQHIDEVIIRMDKRIGELINATKEAGIYEQTTFIVIGDHGQKDVHTKLYLNQLFKEHGLIYEQDGQLHWRAYVQSAGGAAYLYIQESDNNAREKALRIIQDCLHDKRYGLANLLTRPELDALHVPEHIDYMIEAKEGFSFEDDLNKPIIDCLHERGEVYATHGYLPTLDNYTSNLIIAGHQVKQGVTIQSPQVIDLAPTLARLFNIPFGPCDGRVWNEAIKTRD